MTILPILNMIERCTKKDMARMMQLFSAVGLPHHHNFLGEVVADSDDVDATA